MLSRLAEFMVFGLTPLIVGGLLMPSVFAAELRISGEAFYPERIALPPGAQLTVELADVSLADTPVSVIAKQTVAPSGEAPIPFSLAFDPAMLRKNAIYGLQARIVVDDALWAATDERHEIDPLGTAPQKLALKLVAKS